MDFGAALLGLSTAVVIKVLVMVLAGRFLLRLYRVSHVDHPRRMWLLIPPEERPRFRYLTWGLAIFCVAELTCGIEIYILSRSSVLLSSFHGITSALSMGLTAIGLFELFDRKLFHWVDSSRPCVALTLCGACPKRTGQKCRYRNLLPLVSSLLLFFMLPVFWTSTGRLPADPRPYALPFESWNRFYDTVMVPWVSRHFPNVVTDHSAFYIPEGTMILEFRLLPVAVIGIALLSIAAAVRGREDRSAYLFLMAFGAAAYVLFELVTLAVTRDPYFASAIHEMAELFFLVGLAIVLEAVYARAPDEPKEPVPVS